MTNPPIPIGLMAIVQIDDFEFVKTREVGTKKRPRSVMVLDHTERLEAWRPTELLEFWRRMLGEDEGAT